MHNHESAHWIKPLPPQNQEPAWQQLMNMAEQLELQIDVLEPEASSTAASAPGKNIRFLKWLQFFGTELRPRLLPSLLLPNPVRLNAQEVRELTQLRQRPASRAWWRGLRKTKDFDASRDYILATNGNGQMVWVSIEKKTGQYFLHGFFD